MISHEHKCIFVHIPRTGGSSIESLIWPVKRRRHLWMGFVDEYRNEYQTGGLQHLTVQQIRQEVGTDVFDSYFKFSFVRNPWGKVVSQYHEMLQHGPNLPNFVGMEQGDSLAKYLELIQQREHVHWKPQHEFLLDDDGELLVDFLGRYERYEADVEHLMGQLGIDFDVVPHAHATKHGPYQQYYDDVTRKMVRQIYAMDIELFGYSFEAE